MIDAILLTLFIWFVLVLVNMALYVMFEAIIAPILPKYVIDKTDHTLTEPVYYINNNNEVGRREYKTAQVGLGMNSGWWCCVVPFFILWFCVANVSVPIFYPNFKYPNFTKYTKTEDLKYFWLAEYDSYIEKIKIKEELEKHRKNISK